jgi:hypothetical protein
MKEYQHGNLSAILWLSTISILVGLLSIVLASQVQNAKVSKDNNTYLRLNACIVSVPPQRRTPEYVKSCYVSADQSNGTSVQRYGDGK